MSPNYSMQQVQVIVQDSNTQVIVKKETTVITIIKQQPVNEQPSYFITFLSKLLKTNDDELMPKLLFPIPFIFNKFFNITTQTVLKHESERLFEIHEEIDTNLGRTREAIIIQENRMKRRELGLLMETKMNSVVREKLGVGTNMIDWAFTSAWYSFTSSLWYSMVMETMSQGILVYQNKKTFSNGFWNVIRNSLKASWVDMSISLGSSLLSIPLHGFLNQLYQLTPFWFPNETTVIPVQNNCYKIYNIQPFYIGPIEHFVLKLIICYFISQLSLKSETKASFFRPFCLRTCTSFIIPMMIYNWTNSTHPAIPIILTGITKMILNLFEK